MRCFGGGLLSIKVSSAAMASLELDCLSDTESFFGDDAVDRRHVVAIQFVADV